jgi:uncharacterized membrane protein YfcA
VDKTETKDQGGATLAFWKEHRDQMRQSETQRATLTNLILVIVAALVSVITQQKFARHTLPLSILIILAGLYGALACAKYHERATYHLHQARVLTRTLIGLGTLADIGDQLDARRQEHINAYPRLYRLRLHMLWTGLHLGLATLGAVLLLVTLLR